MREIELYVINAFVPHALAPLGTGNPAAVALLTASQQEALSDADRQQLASEINLSETAFVSKSTDVNNGHFFIRWFTPSQEVELCGHATLAAAAALLDKGWVHGEEIVFETVARGNLTVSCTNGRRFLMKFPSAKRKDALEEGELPALVEGLGLVEKDVVRAYRCDDDILMRMKAASCVREACVGAKLRDVRTRGVIVSALNTGGGENGKGRDANVARFVSRFFAPRVGIEEDAVTGSAHCALAREYLEDGEDGVIAHQISPRGGVLAVARKGEAVWLSGWTRIVSRGHILL